MGHNAKCQYANCRQPIEEGYPKDWCPKCGRPFEQPTKTLILPNGITQPVEQPAKVLILPKAITQPEASVSQNKDQPAASARQAAPKPQTTPGDSKFFEEISKVLGPILILYLMYNYGPFAKQRKDYERMVQQHSTQQQRIDEAASQRQFDNSVQHQRQMDRILGQP